MIDRNGILSLAFVLAFQPLHVPAAERPPVGAGPQVGRELLIVAPGRFGKALVPYAKHKLEQLPTRVVALEEILRTSQGVDDPERLKRYLHARWEAGKEGAAAGGRRLYVLLVGDADVLPVRYMVLDRITKPAYDYAFYPSDLYYADLAKADGSFDDWNGQKDGFHARYFGEVRGEKNKDDPINYDGIHYIPEVAVGRWPASTPEEVAVIAEKTIRYERGILKKASSRRAAFVTVGGWVDARGLMERLAAALPAKWTAEMRHYQDGKERYRSPPPTADEVVRLIQGGVSVLCHAGHGKDGEWEGSIGLRDLGRLKNADRLPVIISAGCSTARFATLPPYEAYVDAGGREHRGTDHGEVFDGPPPPPASYQTGRHNPTGLGEALLRRGPTGAVAYIGCNTGSQPCGLTLLEGFVLGLSGVGGLAGGGLSADAEAEELRLGDCWNRAITHYWTKERLGQIVPTESWYPASIFFQGMKFMLFGDPSLLLPHE